MLGGDQILMRLQSGEVHTQHTMREHFPADRRKCAPRVLDVIDVERISAHRLQIPIDECRGNV